MPSFQRNLTEEFYPPYEALDTVIENYLAEVIQTGTVENQLANTALRSAWDGGEFVNEEADNSNEDVKLLITYEMDEANGNNIFPFRQPNNVLQVWWVTYLLSFRYNTAQGRNSYDQYIIKDAMQLVERYCTSNDLRTVTSGVYQPDSYYEFTSTDSVTYKLHPYSSRRVPNPNDGNVYDDVNQTNFLRSQMSILFNITT
jgi:hypothetical protein